MLPLSNYLSFKAYAISNFYNSLPYHKNLRLSITSRVIVCYVCPVPCRKSIANTIDSFS